MINQTQHQTVLLKQTIDLLDVKNNRWYVDATAGGGGHAIEIINRGGSVIAIDRDQSALDRIARLFENLKIPLEKFLLIHGGFGELENLIEKTNVKEIFGFVFDLGLSSDQLNNPDRGFSFLRQGPLDMRMDQSQSLTASEIINKYSESDLNQMFRMWGDEPRSAQIAKAIVMQRSKKSFETTIDLADFIKKKFPSNNPRIHPATRIFQAIRMTVNREPEQLAHGLFHAWNLAINGGVLAIISFHSGEDRMVKRFFFDRQDQGVILTSKSITPNTEEIANNPRSRSAKLRAIKKI